MQAVTDVALAPLSLDESLPELLVGLHRLLVVDTAAILLLDEQAGCLRVRAAVGLDETCARALAIPVGTTFAGRIAAERRPILLDAVGPDDALDPVLRAARVRALVGVPVLGHGRVLGVLHVGARGRRRFTDEDACLLKLVADRLAVAVEGDRAYAAEHEARAAAEACLHALTEVEALKDDLTNMVVHDLKNPLYGIAMLARRALRPGDALPVASRNALGQIERTCREMMRLLQNLLEIRKLEEGKMPVVPEPIALRDVVDEILAEYAAVAGETVRLTAAIGSDLPPMVADCALLKRVLVNLVMNALRHSGSTEVRVEAIYDSAAERIRVQVIDNGRGIAEADQARVFDKFGSIRGRDDRDAGSDTGLGLPFCKLATERMGGAILLSSDPGTGTVFTVLLPTGLQAEARQDG
jgi:signal transduction histidine kinase